MSRIRNGYNSFRIKDLAGGINLRESPNEIENKQAITSVNFNFDGNKLVNSKGHKDFNTYNPSAVNGEIRSIDVIDRKPYITYYDTTEGRTKIARGTTPELGASQNYWVNSLGGTRTLFYSIESVSVGTTYSITVNAVGFVYTETFNYTAVSGDTLSNIYYQFQSKFHSSPYIKCMIGNIKDGTIGIFFWVQLGNSYLTATTTGGNGDIDEGYPLNNSYHNNLFKSGSDLIMIRRSNNAIYLKGLIDNNSSNSEPEAWFPELIDIGNAIYPYSGVYYNGKFVCAEEDNNILYYSQTSDLLNPEKVTNFGGYDGGLQRVGGDGRITGIMTGENGLYVFKEDEIYYSNSVQDDGTGFAFVFNRITNNGAKDKYCITRVGQDIFYYDGINKKVRRLSYEQNLTTLRDTAVSSEIDKFIASQPVINGVQQKLYYNYPNVRLATRSATETNYYNDIIYTYNVDNKSWTTETGKPVKQAYGKYFTKFGVNGKMFEDDYSFSSSGEWISKEFDLGDGVDIKRFSEIEIYGKNTDDITLYLDVYIDNIKKETFTITNNFTDYFRRRFDMWHEGRTIQIGFRYEGIGYIEINEVNFIYKPIKGYNFN